MYILDIFYFTNIKKLVFKTPIDSIVYFFSIIIIHFGALTFDELWNCAVPECQYSPMVHKVVKGA